jgi:tripartite-type tricarboxylate transporter receptor subunit TctC
MGTARATYTKLVKSACPALIGILALVALGSRVAAATSQDYPNRPVQLIIGYGAGTLGDFSMRLVANKLSEELGQPFVVQNRPGAAGIVAAKAAAMAAPDGYTLFLMGNGYAIATAWFKSLPYNVLKDFVPISTVGSFDFLFATKKGSPFKSMQDVIAYAKAHPGKLNIATLTPGTTQNLAVELFKVVAGVNVVAVPFRTSPDAAGALLRGDVDLDLDSYAPLRTLLDGQKIEAIASTGQHRLSFLNNVPTAAESDVPNFYVSSWNAIDAPAGVPQPIIEKLNKAINEAVASQDVQTAGLRLGMEMHGSTPDELQARLKGEIEKWSDLIEKAHIPKHD